MILNQVISDKLTALDPTATTHDANQLERVLKALIGMTDGGAGTCRLHLTTDSIGVLIDAIPEDNTSAFEITAESSPSLLELQQLAAKKLIDWKIASIDDADAVAIAFAITDLNSPDAVRDQIANTASLGNLASVKPDKDQLTQLIPDDLALRYQDSLMEKAKRSEFQALVEKFEHATNEMRPSKPLTAEEWGQLLEAIKQATTYGLFISKFPRKDDDQVEPYIKSIITEAVFIDYKSKQFGADKQAILSDMRIILDARKLPDPQKHSSYRRLQDLMANSKAYFDPVMGKERARQVEDGLKKLRDDAVITANYLAQQQKNIEVLGLQIDPYYAVVQEKLNQHNTFIKSLNTCLNDLAIAKDPKITGVKLEPLNVKVSTGPVNFKDLLDPAKLNTVKNELLELNKTASPGAGLNGVGAVTGITAPSPTADLTTYIIDTNQYALHPVIMDKLDTSTHTSQPEVQGIYVEDRPPLGRKIGEDEPKRVNGLKWPSDEKAKIQMAMDMATTLLATRKNPPSKRDPIIITGKDPEQISYLYVALQLIGKNTPGMKFGNSAMKLCTKMYEPKRDKGVRFAFTQGDDHMVYENALEKLRTFRQEESQVAKIKPSDVLKQANRLMHTNLQGKMKERTEATVQEAQETERNRNNSPGSPS